MLITAGQSRAARALLDITQVEIAKAADLSESTVRDFEKGRRVPSTNNLKALRAAYEAMGVLVLAEGDAMNGGPGVRLAKAPE